MTKKLRVAPVRLPARRHAQILPMMRIGQPVQNIPQPSASTMGCLLFGDDHSVTKPLLVLPNDLPLNCEPRAGQDAQSSTILSTHAGSSTAAVGYLPTRTAIKTTAQDRGSTRSSIWPLALGRSTHACEQSFRPWQAKTSHTLDGKRAPWA